MSEHQQPAPALIEIIEKRHEGFDPANPHTGYIVPTEVRINGIPLAVPRDEDITVHEISTRADQAVMVTLTLFARRVLIGPGTDAEPTP